MFKAIQAQYIIFMKIKNLKIAFLFFVLIHTAPALALETPWTSADHMQIRLVSGVDTIGNFDNFDAAIDMRTDEGWHSYWRTPGDSGLPPRFDWSDSENIDSVKILYPTPKRFDEYGLSTFGYGSSVMFPLHVLLKETGKPAILYLKIETMVCNDICIPQILSANLSIPAGAGQSSDIAKLIDYAKTKVPYKGEVKGLSIDTAVASVNALAVSVRSNEGFEGADIFVEVSDGKETIALTSVPEIVPDEKDKRHAIFKIQKPYDVKDLGAFLAGKKIILTISKGSRAVEKELQF